MVSAALIAAALLPLSLGSGLAYDYDASLRLEERMRQVRPIPGTAVTDWATEAQPSLTLTAAARTADLALTYDPRLTFQKSSAGRDLTWLHMGMLVGSWRPDDAWRLRLAGQVTRGSNDLFRFLSNNSTDGNTPPVAQLAPVSTIDYQNYDLSLGATATISGRLSFRGSLGGSREGGLGEAARDFLPLQQGGRASAGLDWRLTRVDTLGFALSGSAMHWFDVPLTSDGTVGGPTRASWTTWTGRLGATWRRGVDKETSSYLGAGLALVGGDGRGQDGLRALPSAEVGMSHAPKLRDQRLQGGVGLALAPLEDRLAGAIVERTDLRGWISWFPVDRWSFHGATSGGLVVTGSSRGDAIGSADARIGWAATQFMSVSLGLRGSMQNQQNLAVPRFLEWSAYLAVSLIDKGRM